MKARTQWTAAAITDPGRCRRENEDRYFLNNAAGIYMVADGVASTNAGEIAADMAVNIIPARLSRKDGTPRDRMREAIALANNDIFAYAGQHPSRRGMACVATVVLIEDGHGIAGQVGDSRLYRIRDGAIELLTPDHSPVGELVASGEIDEEQAMCHPDRNQIYRDIGTENRHKDDENFIDIVEFQVQPCDAFVAVTDGVCDLIPSRRIHRIIEDHCGDPASVASELIRAANEAGGRDNATAVYVEGPAFAASVKRRKAVIPITEPEHRHRVPSAIWAIGALASLTAAYWLGARTASAEPPPRPPMEISVGATRTFARLDTALKSAVPGDRLMLDAGEYTVDPLLIRFPVAIEAREPRTAILNARGPACIQVENAEGVRLTGLVIRPAPNRTLTSAIVISGGSAQIELTGISGAAESGVAIRNNAIAVLRANHFHDNPGVAIRADDGTSVKLWHNLIRGEPGLDFRQGTAWKGNTVAADGLKTSGISPEILLENLLTSVTRSRR